MTGAISSPWSTGANLVHVVGVASMTYITGKSFRGVMDAADNKKNCLPPLMLACSRLSLVLSQIGAMSIATAAIQIVSATAMWTPLVNYLTAGVFGVMVFRLSGALFLQSTFGEKGSVVSTVTSMQSKAGSAFLLHCSVLLR